LDTDERRSDADRTQYSIIRRPKRKTASIVVRADNRVEVLAPSDMPASLIDAFIRQKSAWIHQKLYFNNEIRAKYTPKTFQPGELFHLLGKAYALRVHQGRRAIRCVGQELIVSHPAPEPQTTASQISRWYRQQAEAHIQSRCLLLADRVGKEPKRIGIKSYKSRWGSCHHDGRIYFNWRLMMAPEEVIDYVVVHELCHLIHGNHSKDFWALVQSIAPDYKEAKKWLDIHGLTLSL